MRTPSDFTGFQAGRPSAATGPAIAGGLRTEVSATRNSTSACPDCDQDFCGADDGIRTRDPHLGKVMLYQLSHVRVSGHVTASDPSGTSPICASPHCLRAVD